MDSKKKKEPKSEVSLAASIAQNPNMKLSSQPELRRRSPAEKHEKRHNPLPSPLSLFLFWKPLVWSSWNNTGVIHKRARLWYTYKLGVRKCLAMAVCERWWFQVAPCPMICCQTGTIYDRQRALFLLFFSIPPLVDAKSAPPPPSLLLFIPSHKKRGERKRRNKKKKNDINISKRTIDRRAEALVHGHGSAQKNDARFCLLPFSSSCVWQWNARRDISCVSKDIES